MEKADERRFQCPCCGFLRIGELPPGTFEICVVCGWEDDEVQFDHPDSSGGANKVSLNEARANFKKFGACDKGWLKNVRPPRPDEIP
jgi:hypothetical protein